jgi:hypothetical protein
MAVNDLITFRKGTASAWTSANPVLASGEPGYDLTNSILKIGDGVSNWASLSGIGSTSVGGGSSSTSVRGNVIATGTLSSFNISGGYTAGYLDLFQNGVKLLSGSDFTATDGTLVTLSNSVPSGTVLEYVSLDASVSSSNYTKLDNISSSFNGSSTSFGLAVSGTPYYPVSANTLGIYVGGVAQEPISSYSVSGSNIVFTEAPASGLTFWGVGYGTTAVATLNGIVPGSSGFPAISSSNDLTTGFYFPSSGNISVAGNLGIGTSSPSSKLHVAGTITANSGNFSQNLQVNNVNVSVSGHSHTVSDITNFNSSVSGLLPITNIIAGSGINLAISGTTVTITSNDTRWNLFLPPAPTSVFSQVSGTTATLSWAQPLATYIPPITDYVVQYSSNSGSTWTTFADGTSTATSATVTGLTSGTAYLFRAAAVNGIGTSSYASATAVQRYSPSSASTNRNTYSGTEPDKAADNDSATYFQSSDNNQVPVYLTYDLGSAKTVAMYRLLGGGGGGYNDPGVWTLQASSDNSTWTTMDSRTVTTLAGGPYTFAVATPASYRYYRLAISALTVGSNVAIASFDVFGA